MEDTSLISVATLYRAGKVKDYVVEKETAMALGGNCSVKLVTPTTIESFMIFILPEMRAEGFHLTYFVDSRAVLERYTPEDYEIVIKRLAGNTQKVLTKYNKFRNEIGGNELTKSYFIGFLLGLYASYMGLLKMDDVQTGYIDDDEVLKCGEKFTIGKIEDEDLEHLVGSGMMCREIMEAVDAIIGKQGIQIDGVKLTFRITDGAEEYKPIFNLGYQEVRKYCTSDYGTRKHEEIPYDYIPLTEEAEEDEEAKKN